MQGALAELMARYAQPGHVTWIGLRAERKAPMTPVDAAEVAPNGLVGDHARSGKRAITLIQAEHFPVITALAGRTDVSPDVLRRNIVVSGINLTALRNHPLQIGDAVLEITAPCAPCSRMEEALGPGGYNAMRGHGGWCARVVSPGRIAIGSTVSKSADSQNLSPLTRDIR